jgi:hypothetical protein
VNFILGTIDAKLRRTYPEEGNDPSSMAVQTHSNSGGHLRLVGAMDLGGASTQIIFPFRKAAPNNDVVDIVSDSVSTSNFWAASYLHYGSITIHSRLLRYLATHHVFDVDQNGSGKSTDDVLDDKQDKKGASSGSSMRNISSAILIHNPCDMVQHR